MSVVRRFFRALSLLAAVAGLALAGSPSAQAETKFKPISVQYIAALAGPTATSGTGAENWGLWPIDPGPRGVWLKYFDILKAVGFSPSAWKFNQDDWWLDENGLIMEHPGYGMPPGKYLVSGARETVGVLTIHPKDQTGTQRWELDKGATIYDVTHLKCRSARYRPAAPGKLCTPANVLRNNFPVKPGTEMPAVEDCSKQDYTVLFIIGVEDKG